MGRGEVQPILSVRKQLSSECDRDRLMTIPALANKIKPDFSLSFKFSEVAG